MYRRGLFLLAVAGLALAACDDSSSPDGSASTVAVRAYVDADGTGTFTTGDVPLPGLAVTLNPTSGGSSLSAQTDAQGVATFTSVRPGSYGAQVTGNVPQGAVLSSAETAVVVAPYQGAELGAEFRYAYMPGTVSGVLYRDNNANNQYDAGVDTPAPGLPVLLFGAGSTAIDSTTTSVAGGFTFGPRRPGSYRVVVRPLPTMSIVGGDTIAVTVQPQAPASVGVRFTGNLLSPVSQVRQQPSGSVVAFEGVATVGVGVFSTSTTGNQFNVQDASGAGILILGVPLASGIQAGDSVRVVGTTRVSSGEYLINSTPAPVITRLGTGTVPAPRAVTGAQVVSADSASPLQGLLVTVGGVVVDSVQGGTSAGYNVYVRDNAGNRFVVRVGTANVGVTRDAWIVGRTYDVTGTLGWFNGPQVKVRSAADVRLRTSATPIGTLRARAFADSAGTRFDTVTVEGVVHTAQGTFRTDNAYIQDATGGILLFNVPAGAGLAVGDSVRVTAAVDWFNGELELVRFSSTSPPVIEELGIGATPLPRTISGTQMKARTYEGQLVRLGNATVDSVGVPSSSGAYTVWLITTDAQRVEVRIENNSIGIPAASWVKGTQVNVVGALSHFRGTPQLKPRNAADVTAGTAGVISIAAAEARANGDTVMVEGVVIAPVGIFGSATGTSTNAYIQDGTGGIQIFGVPATVTLDVGDLVRVRGLTGQFSGEEQIARFSSSVLLDVTELGAGAAPLPRAITGAELVARTYEGELVTLAGVTVTAVGTVSTSGGYNVTATAADGTVITIRHDRTAVNVPVGFWVVGGVYDVTGVPSAFNSAAQLKIRGPGDVVRR